MTNEAQDFKEKEYNWYRISKLSTQPLIGRLFIKDVYENRLKIFVL